MVKLGRGPIKAGSGGGFVFAIAAYTTLLVLLSSNRLYYANGIEIDEHEPQPQLQRQFQLQQQQRRADGDGAFRDTSVNSDSDNLISFTNQSSSQSVDSLINSHSKQTKHDRVRRNSILTAAALGSQNGGGGLLGNNFSPVPQVQPAQQNLEGLLASCQLTNLLLYQLVNNQQQQKAAIAPGLLAAPAAPFLSPFNPFLQPAVGPLLTTYTTTSTYTTKMTSTDVITIPLLFGNKPSPTTVTRTKTYDVTTSTELTLTSTILPTTTTTTVIQIVPTAEVAGGLAPTKVGKYGADAAIEPSVVGGHYETPILNALNADDASTAPSTPSRSKKKRKNRPSSSQKQGRVLQYQDELAEVNQALARDSSPAYKYGQREKQQLVELKSPPRGSTKFRRQYIHEDGATQLENPDYYIADYYPSEVLHNHNQQRLKRRGEVEVDSIDAGSSPDEFILEPSFDSSSNVQLAEECPATTVTQTVTLTSTKTVTKTKLVNPATPLSGLVRETDALQPPNHINYEATNRAKKNFISTRGNDDRRSSSGSRSSGSIGGSGSGFSKSSKGRVASSPSTSTTERSGRNANGERRRGSHRQRSTTPDSLFLSSSTNNYYGSNLNPNANSNGNTDINSRRSRSRFHANYYAGRASY